jgi:hypothetical protein
MFTRKLYALHTALLFTPLLFGSVSAFAQKQTLQGLPSVNLGLPVLPRIDPPKLPVDATLTVSVPSVGGLTPPLNATVNVGGSGPGVPPVPAPQDPLAERRLELLPTCR